MVRLGSLLALTFAASASAQGIVDLFEIVPCSITIADVLVSADVDSRCCADLQSFQGFLSIIGSEGDLLEFLGTSERACFSNTFTSCLDYVAALVNANPTPFSTTAAAAAASCPLNELTCCAFGNKHVDGSVCCPPECPECGGLFCASAGPGDQCCKTFLSLNAPPCTSVDQTGCQCPVVSRTAPSSAPTDVSGRSRRAVEDVRVENRPQMTKEQRAKMCASGIVHEVEPECEHCQAPRSAATIEVCCDASCGSCGGEFCNLLSTPDMTCCVEDILTSNAFCTEESQVGCILEATVPWLDEVA